MSDFNDDYDPDEVIDAMEDARDAARDERHEVAAERFGFGVCRTGVCVEPCGMDGGCKR